jgi:hypothetical protein
MRGTNKYMETELIYFDIHRGLFLNQKRLNVSEYSVKMSKSAS